MTLITGTLGGTITTVTNLTNLPAITANWLTATGIDASAVTEIVSAIDMNPSIAVSSVEALLASTGSMAMSVRYTMRETVTSTITDDLSAATKLWFAIKEDGETDANSLIFCEETAGLTIVDKAAHGTAADGTLTVSGSSGAWSVAIMIDEAATTLLSAYVNNYYDASVKALIGGNAVHVWDGKCRIVLGVIQAIV